MKLLECEGSDLFEKYGINVPVRELLETSDSTLTLPMPVVLKAQVLSGDRKKAGGVLFADTKEEAKEKTSELFGKKFQGEKTQKVLAVEKLDFVEEYYISFSYDTDSRQPVLSVSTDGGSGIDNAHVTPIDILEGVDEVKTQEILKLAGFPEDELSNIRDVVTKLWIIFIEEYAKLVEINPLVKLKDGSFIAADAKVIIDDDKEQPGSGRIIDMDGDIAVLASGGGASLLNVDALLNAGGKPSNYTEYSGNPPAETVTELTKRVLSKKGIKGCWVVGGMANFTDIYETLSGFVEGLRQLKEKPTYPIVIRRDGPRQEEAFEMLENVKKDEGFDLHIYDSKTPMAKTAEIIVELVSGK